MLVNDKRTRFEQLRSLLDALGKALHIFAGPLSWISRKAFYLALVHGKRGQFESCVHNDMLLR